jgi:predicted DNA-binding transcriptional regulator AlpA
MKKSTRAKKPVRYGRGKSPNSHQPHKPNELPPLPPLSPHEIVRWVDGPRYFGFQHTQMQKFIELGKIPEPMPLCGRSKGWLGSTIIDWQQKRAEKHTAELAEKRRARQAEDAS